MTDPSAAPVAPPSYLRAALPDLGGWTRHFRDAPIPVLARTAEELERLRVIEDDVDAAMIGDFVQRDPLMTLKVLSYAASRRRPGIATDTETVTSSLVMMGISPFFKNFGLQPTVEAQLHDQPEALAGLHDLLQRAERAANFALAFAVHRSDPDAAVIHQAAFLHDFVEMLMWCHAPTLQLQIQGAQRADPALRSAKVQHDVLNIEMDTLRLTLMRLWHLPELLVRISDPRHMEQNTVHNVVLAVRLARHTMHGWDNAALPDDVEDIAKLLNVAPRVALAFVRKVDQA